MLRPAELLHFHDLSFSSSLCWVFIKNSTHARNRGCLGDGESERPAESGPKHQQAPCISPDIKPTFSLLLVNRINGI